jgi:hypothetical protein
MWSKLSFTSMKKPPLVGYLTAAPAAAAEQQQDQYNTEVRNARPWHNLAQKPHPLRSLACCSPALPACHWYAHLNPPLEPKDNRARDCRNNNITPSSPVFL